MDDGNEDAVRTESTLKRGILNIQLESTIDLFRDVQNDVHRMDFRDREESVMDIGNMAMLPDAKMGIY